MRIDCQPSDRTSPSARARGVIFALLWAVLMNHPASAAPVTVTFDARIDSITSSVLATFTSFTGLSVGDTISGSYTFDDVTPDAAPGNPTMGSYVGALIQAQVQLGNELLLYDPAISATNTMLIANDYNFGGTPIDGFAPQLLGADADFGGIALDSADLELLLGTSLLSLFASDALFSAEPALPIAGYDVVNQATIRGVLGADDFEVLATIVQNPEPGTGLMVGLGLAMLGMRRRT